MNISIAMCTYNGAKYLGEQLDSFVAQSRLPDELVVCDDRSTDETVAILERFAVSSPFNVRLFVNENNLGSTKNFEKAIGLCLGEVICLSDQDDVWHSEKLDRIEHVFSTLPQVGMVFSDAKLADGRLRPTGLKLSNFVFRRGDLAKVAESRALEILLEYNCVTGATMAFRSIYREAFLPIPECTDLIHDGWISLITAIHSDIQYINETLVTYRQHRDQELGLLMPKLKVSARQRHSNYVENRKRALERLQEMRSSVESGEMSENAAACGLKMTLGKSELMVLIDRAYASVEESIKHFEVRSKLPLARLARIAPILGELRTGRYRKYSRGLVAALADLLGR